MRNDCTGQSWRESTSTTPAWEKWKRTGKHCGRC
ncbi:hypothetical protein [Rhodobacteraceae phage LS06-2018-MD07]|nr:hypothetical protein [Rhodobacteraceae phage LS06-2018-MD07]